MSSNPRHTRVFEALANEYRRQLLVALLEKNPQDDDDIDPLNLLLANQSADDMDATEMRLKHVHLPKLAEMGFIEWDEDTGSIATGPDWDEIEPLLQLISDHRDELPDEWLSAPQTDV